MMKLKIILLFLIFSLSKAQSDVVGKYHQRSGNPDDGGYTWFFFENHQFAMVTFGQIISGKWEIDANHIITLTPTIPDQPFDVYGRYDSTIKGTEIMFNNFDINEQTFIGNYENGVQPVLSDDANCLPYPLIHHFKENYKEIILGVETFTENQTLLFYKTDTTNFNRFIITYYPSHNRISPFTVRFNDHKIYFFNDEYAEQKKINAEERNEIEKYINMENQYLSPENIVTNKGFNIISYYGFDDNPDFNEKSFLENNYKYNASQNSYEAKFRNENDSEDDYHNINTLYPYKKLNLSDEKQAYTTKKESLFHITCQ